jgi:hypothetical protein
MTEEKKSGVISVSFWLGVSLYVTSFFLPAVENMKGWVCALATLRPETAFKSMVFYPGLINPLVVTFAVAKILNEAPRLRLALAAGTLALFIPTWLVVAQMKIMLGCAMWVVSILLVVAEDFGGCGIALRQTR